jgi:hypothetical protein
MMPRKLNWASFLSVAHLKRLLFVYAAFMFTGGALTFAVYLVLERPQSGIFFLAGVVCGMFASIVALWVRRPINVMFSQLEEYAEWQRHRFPSDETKTMSIEAKQRR